MKPLIVCLISGPVRIETREELERAVESAACKAIGDFMMCGFRTEDLPLFADAIIGKLVENGDLSPEAIRAVVSGGNKRE